VKAFPQVRRRSRLSCSTGTNLGTLRETPGRAQKTKNRGNEAKESLKTKEVAKTKCAKRTQICAQIPANEAKKAQFRCKNGTSTGGVRLSQVKSLPAALRIAGSGGAQTCQRPACLIHHPLPGRRSLTLPPVPLFPLPWGEGRGGGELG
jgi:hypothetical protein